MLARDCVVHAKEILEKNIPALITRLTIDFEDPKVHVELRDGTHLYVQFNDHNQYSYTIVYSTILKDEARYDNYDDRWNVSTKPHHFHPRGERKAQDSPMIGDPVKDMVTLSKLINSKKILQKQANK